MGDRCGHERGAKVPAAVDTLRWRIARQEMDLLLSVPSNPCLQPTALPWLPLSSALLSTRVFVWREFRLFVMGVLPATLFLLSVWHFRWTRPWFYLCTPPPSSRCENLLGLCLICSHRRAAFSDLSLSVFNTYMHPTHLFILYFDNVVLWMG